MQNAIRWSFLRSSLDLYNSRSTIESAYELRNLRGWGHLGYVVFGSYRS